MSEHLINKAISDITLLARVVSRNTAYLVSADYSPHTDQFDVLLRKNADGWIVIARETIYLDNEKALDTLSVVKHKLTDLLSSGEIVITDYHLGMHGRRSPTYFFADPPKWKKFVMDQEDVDRFHLEIGMVMPAAQ